MRRVPGSGRANKQSVGGSKGPSGMFAPAKGLVTPGMKSSLLLAPAKSLVTPGVGPSPMLAPARGLVSPGMKPSPTLGPARGLITPGVRPDVLSAMGSRSFGGQGPSFGGQGGFRDFARQNMGGQGPAYGQQRGGILLNPNAGQVFGSQGKGAGFGADIPTMGLGLTQDRQRQLGALLQLGRRGEGPTQFGFASGQPFAGLGLQKR